MQQHVDLIYLLYHFSHKNVRNKFFNFLHDFIDSNTPPLTYAYARVGENMNNAIQPEEIYQLIDQDICFIDIRDPYQFKKLHLKNFQNIPYDQLDITSFPHHQPIVLLCYSGKRTEELSKQLNLLGYQAYYIQGGIQAFLNIHNEKYF